jgi:DNA-directed RNA polymerase subunit RPC12/RpoP
MLRLNKHVTTTQCISCGAAMVLERIQPDPIDARSERHEFRCEICSSEAFFKFVIGETSSEQRRRLRVNGQR